MFRVRRVIPRASGDVRELRPASRDVVWSACVFPPDTLGTLDEICSAPGARHILELGVS